jgi:hypothetical protein
MPATAIHWLVLIFGVSLGQFILKYIFNVLATLDQIPGAHKLGTSLATIIP